MVTLDLNRRGFLAASLATGAVALVAVPGLDWALHLPSATDALLLAALLVPQTLSGGVQGLALGRKGWGLSVAGLLPLAMGAFDWCLLSPLQGLPFKGSQLREVLGSEPAYEWGLSTISKS